jgi:predicted O-linked N-acetylglucosamine transferase (SPINDLY family)
MDYIIADEPVIPVEQQRHYTEKVLYLPGCYLPTDPEVKISERIPTRAEYQLPETGFVFCSFNHDYKINPPVFDVWMSVLKRVEGSVLWLMRLNDTAEANLRKEALQRGVDPSRLIFAGRVPAISDHLARYRLAGLFLDTTPYNAHSTATDVLRAGLPVLTLEGKAFQSRVAPLVILIFLVLI